MHSLKYPYAKVNGLLLSKNRSSNDNELEYVDYIPLFHFNQGLTAMLEIALIQIQAYCTKHNLQIAGYFQVNKNFHDSSIDVFGQRIGEKLIELNPKTSIVILNSCNLADSLSKDVDLKNTLNLYEYVDSKWKAGSISIDCDDQEVVDAIRYFIFKQQDHLNLNDFDCHLHDIKCDWLNKNINHLIDDWLNAD